MKPVAFVNSDEPQLESALGLGRLLKRFQAEVDIFVSIESILNNRCLFCDANHGKFLLKRTIYLSVFILET